MSRGLEECRVLHRWIYILDLEQKLQNKRTALLPSSFHNTQTALLWLSSHLYKTYQPSSSTETDQKRYSWILLLMSDTNQQFNKKRWCQFFLFSLKEWLYLLFSSDLFVHWLRKLILFTIYWNSSSGSVFMSSEIENWTVNHSLHLLFSTALCTLFLLTALVVFSLQDIDGLWLTDQPAVASARKTLGHVSWSDLAMSTDLCYVGETGTARWKADVWNFRLLHKCFWRSHQWTEWLKREQVEHVLSIYTLSINIFLFLCLINVLIFMLGRMSVYYSTTYN